MKKFLLLLALLMIFTFSVFSAEVPSQSTTPSSIYFDEYNVTAPGQFAALISTLSFTVPDSYIYNWNGDKVYLNIVAQGNGSFSDLKVIGLVYGNPNYEAKADIKYLVRAENRQKIIGQDLWFDNKPMAIDFDISPYVGQTLYFEFYVVSQREASLCTMGETYRVEDLRTIGTLNLGFSEFAWKTPVDEVELNSNGDIPIISPSIVDPETGVIVSPDGKPTNYGGNSDPNPPTLAMSLEDKGATLSSTGTTEVGIITLTPENISDGGSLNAQIKFTGDFYLKLTANNSVVVPNVTIDYALYYEGETVVPSTNDTFDYTFTSNTAITKSITAEITEANLSSKPAGTYTDTITITMTILE